MAGWITEGSAGFSIDGNVVTHVYDNKGGGNVFNALWQEGDGVSSGKHYWKIQFTKLEGGTGVGLTSKDYFKEGYGCKAINYLGNLSNGGGLLVGNFGPGPKEGDVIGVLADFEGDRLKVYIDVNGISLGLAFDVPASTFKSIFPVVSFHKSGSAICTKQTELPSNTIRVPTTFTDIEGDWKITNLQEDGVVVDLPCSPTTRRTSQIHRLWIKLINWINCTKFGLIKSRPFSPSTLISKKETDKYSWFVNVCNGLRTGLSKVDGNWKTSGVYRTMMRAPSEYRTVEKVIGNLMEEVKKVEIDESGFLSIQSDKISSTWARYDSAPGPFVGEPFA